MIKEEKFNIYERETDIILRTDELIVMRFDGIDFTKKNLRKFSNEEYLAYNRVIELCIFDLFLMHPNIKVGYFGVDEISLILCGRSVIENYDNRLQKLISILSSEITMLFHKHKKKLSEKITIKYSSFFDSGTYAGKVYNLPKDRMNEYLRWRQEATKGFTSDNISSDQIKQIMNGGFVYVESGKPVNHSVDLISNHNNKIVFKPQGEIGIVMINTNTHTKKKDAK